MTTKICKTCQEEKDISNYYTNNKEKTIFKPNCKTCIKNKIIVPKDLDNKKCKTCQTILPVEDFYFNSKAKNTRKPNCKKCMKSLRKKKEE